MIQTLLVANRGEIARRVFRTCKELGVATVAVYSDADANAAHTREADAAVRLPGDAPADTYLRADSLVRAALAAGADAVHPGYGFLSESPGFAERVREAGLLWVGPPPAAMAAMAVKTRAKELMRAAGVPLLDPLEPSGITEADLPVLVKASAGGGGRGMRVVRRIATLEADLQAAAKEAADAFGEGEVFVEPYVEGGRHVEVQVVADTHDAVWALGTRDCSVQRRHQKVVEEAPAPGLDEELRQRLSDAAVRAVRTVGYIGVGTVEFLLTPDGRPYFLEMNTRLQVEHPVTEAVYGVDLVALQLAVAEGLPLPTERPRPTGHAVEARLYAEDPARDWQPGIGPLHHFSVPRVPGLRVDSAVEDGDAVSEHYDPMLAKVIAYAPSREAAIRKLAGGLAAARVHGPVTNRDLLLAILGDPEFRRGAPDTAFLDRRLEALTSASADRPGTEVAALAVTVADAWGRSRFGGWRNLPSRPHSRRYRREPDGDEWEIRYRLTREGLHAPDQPDVALVRAGRNGVELEVDGVRRKFEVSRYGAHRYVDSALGNWTFTELSRFPDRTTRAEPGSLLAPMPGTVTRVAAGMTAGAVVSAGQPLLWLEAMKMEHLVSAPTHGVLTALNVEAGRQVEVGALLAVVTPPSDAEPGPDGPAGPETLSGEPEARGTGPRPPRVPSAAQGGVAAVSEEN